MDIRKLQRAIVDGLEDVKAHDIAVFNTEHLSPLFERVIIASGTSNRQTKALAASVRDAVRASGFSLMRTEGEDNGEWIIVDCGAAVAHIMQPAIRQYYHLEEIWGGKAVKMKFGEVTTRLVKASDSDAPSPKKAVANKAAASRTAARKPVSKAAAGKRTTGKQAAGKQVASKQAASKQAASKQAASKRPAGKKAASRPAAKPPAKKSVARTGARQATGKSIGKTAARKAGTAKKSAAARTRRT